MREMWVRTTVERWTKEKTKDNADTWDESSRGKEKPGQIRGGLSAGAMAEGAGLRPQGRCRTREPDEGGGAKGWVGRS